MLSLTGVCLTDRRTGRTIDSIETRHRGPGKDPSGGRLADILSMGQSHMIKCRIAQLGYHVTGKTVVAGPRVF